MQAVLINRTDDIGHHGCTLVNRQLDALARNAGIEIVAKLPLHADWDALAPDRFDAVIVNGEGTLHSSNRGARRIAEIPAWAARRGVPAHLINSVYQNNNDTIAAQVARFATIAVRDTRSAAEMSRHGIDPRVVPDLSLTWQVEPAHLTGDKIIINGSVSKTARGRLYALSGRDRPYVPITSRPPRDKDAQRFYDAKRALAMIRPPGVKRAHLRNSIATFDEFVSCLRAHASGIVTGRFHMVTIALCLEIPVMAVPSNTHKIEALLEHLDMPGRLAEHPRDALRMLRSYTTAEIERIRALRREARTNADRLFQEIRSHQHDARAWSVA
ncbi:polysaccharide pyruvyl transferase family protein [Dichotomicrobium thermohalophilum]|uniref:Polysaccharide pyruvyl transferase n=1 Tax=Dichotomicrobium thermohalophilum TaxID=933063 RepID=A0A397Q4S4_9HYPH|nr:polysaccharide pyruvyl transferase family protein [Dichotomicrobium thermohalophilum]RIA56326.1 polysaccharide pyruvyl transferase [Dichotomicrobium thermohalophilum]